MCNCDGHCKNPEEVGFFLGKPEGDNTDFMTNMYTLQLLMAIVCMSPEPLENIDELKQRVERFTRKLTAQADELCKRAEEALKEGFGNEV